MGKKKGLGSIFYKLVDSPSPSPSHHFSPAPWPWPSACRNPTTSSFRAGAAASGAANDIYKTVNSVFFDSAESSFDEDGGAGEAEEDGFSTAGSEESSEAVIRSLGRTSTDRLLFDPGSMKLVDGKRPPPPPPPPPEAVFEESVAVAVDSADPYGDFRASMEEMVAAHGLRDWAALQELLLWYLRINRKHNHGFIVGAFVDLLVGLATATTTPAATTTTRSGNGAATSSTCTTSATSCSSTSCLTSSEEIREERA